MSCILYNYSSYVHLFKSDIIKKLNNYIAEPFDAITLYDLNVAAYKARYSQERTKDFLITSEEILEPADYEFLATNLDSHVSIYKLLNRISYQLSDIQGDREIFEANKTQYLSWIQLMLNVADEIIRGNK